MRTIDLNADLGETVDGKPTADDEAMFAVISSANVACGGHAGDAASMAEAVARAARTGVAVGAHPSYPDRANFGRVAVEIDPADLERTVRSQIDALADAGADIRYVKPHGALYNRIVSDAQQADAVARAVAGFAEAQGRPVPVLGLHGEIARAVAHAGLPFVAEAFLDRAYLPDGTLVPRTEADAVLDDVDAASARAVRLAEHGTLTARDGSEIAVSAASLCVHGDSPAAVGMARGVRSALDAHGIEVRAPW